MRYAACFTAILPISANLWLFGLTVPCRSSEGRVLDDSSFKVPTFMGHKSQGRRGGRPLIIFFELHKPPMVTWVAVKGGPRKGGVHLDP